MFESNWKYVTTMHLDEKMGRKKWLRMDLKNG
jgi:hypothetical protein